MNKKPTFRELYIAECERQLSEEIVARVEALALGDRGEEALAEAVELGGFHGGGLLRAIIDDSVEWMPEINPVEEASEKPSVVSGRRVKMRWRPQFEVNQGRDQKNRKNSDSFRDRLDAVKKKNFVPFDFLKMGHPSSEVFENSGVDLGPDFLNGSCLLRDLCLPAPGGYVTYNPEVDEGLVVQNIDESEAEGKVVEPGSRHFANYMVPYGFEPVGVDFVVDPRNPMRHLAVGEKKKKYGLRRKKALPKWTNEDLSPSNEEINYWRKEFPLPEEIVKQIELAPEKVPQIIAQYIHQEFVYYLSPNLGKFLDKYKDRLNEVFEYYKLGDCGLLSWILCVYLRSYGISAMVTHEEISDRNGKFSRIGHARVVLLDQEGGVCFSDPAAIVPLSRYHGWSTIKDEDVYWLKMAEGEISLEEGVRYYAPREKARLRNGLSSCDYKFLDFLGPSSSSKWWFKNVQYGLESHIFPFFDANPQVLGHECNDGSEFRRFFDCDDLDDLPACFFGKEEVATDILVNEGRMEIFYKFFYFSYHQKWPAHLCFEVEGGLFAPFQRWQRDLDNSCLLSSATELCSEEVFDDYWYEVDGILEVSSGNLANVYFSRNLDRNYSFSSDFKTFVKEREGNFNVSELQKHLWLIKERAERVGGYNVGFNEVLEFEIDSFALVLLVLRSFADVALRRHLEESLGLSKIFFRKFANSFLKRNLKGRKSVVRSLWAEGRQKDKKFFNFGSFDRVFELEEADEKEVRSNVISFVNKFVRGEQKRAVTKGERFSVKEYSPGDHDVRHIAWDLLARTNKVMVRLPEQVKAKEEPFYFALDFFDQSESYVYNATYLSNVVPTVRIFVEELVNFARRGVPIRVTSGVVGCYFDLNSLLARGTNVEDIVVMLCGPEVPKCNPRLKTKEGIPQNMAFVTFSQCAAAAVDYGLSKRGRNLVSTTFEDAGMMAWAKMRKID